MITLQAIPLFDDTGLGVEGDAEAGFRDHRQVVGTITHGNGLGEVHLLHLGDELQKFCLAMAIDNLTHITAREFTVLTDFEFVGIDIVDAITTLQIFAEIGESAREDGDLIATALQNRHQTVDALCDGKILGNLLHHTDIEALQQSHPSCETLLEVNLTTHGALRDGTHLSPHPIALCQFVDALRLYQRGVHIEADEATHTTEHIVALEGEVDLHLPDGW